MSNNSAKNDRRVVVTGMGIISPIGLTVSDAWEALISGKSGLGYISSFDTTLFKTKYAAEVKGFDPCDYVSLKEAERMDRFTQFAVARLDSKLMQFDMPMMIAADLAEDRVTEFKQRGER